MKVRIVCYEDVDRWILGKFAKKMHECLIQMGVDCDIAKVSNKNADINHHIIYSDYDGVNNGVDTLMITHIDNIDKFNLLKKQLESATLGICMSKETMQKLSSIGIPNSKLSYINPAHDGNIIPRTKTIGLTCRVQIDGRKREHFISRLAKDISPKHFSFKIMGDGWDVQVNDLINNGFKVEYHPNFHYGKYLDLIQSLDYYLYMGQDEGQMGFIDALAAGVETIVTPQGYHLDAENGITYPFNEYNELVEILTKIEKKMDLLVNSIITWNWADYTKKHLEIWNYLTGKQINSKYSDGYNSMNNTNKYTKVSFIQRCKILLLLILGKLRHSYNARINKNNEI